MELIKLRAKDFIEKNNDMTVLFNKDDKVYRGYIVTLNTLGEYTVKIEGIENGNEE